MTESGCEGSNKTQTEKTTKTFDRYSQITERTQAKLDWEYKRKTDREGSIRGIGPQRNAPVTISEYQTQPYKMKNDMKVKSHQQTGIYGTRSEEGNGS